MVIGLKGLDRAAVTKALARIAMHLLQTTLTTSTTSSSRSISARRRAISWCCRSPTATSPGWPRPTRRSSDASAERCGSRIFASCATRCRSISGSTRCARHAKVIVVRLLGGLDWWRYGVEALGGRRPRARASRSRCCPARTATIRASMTASTLPPDELAALLAYFREGGRREFAALCCRRLAGSCRANHWLHLSLTGAAHGRLSPGPAAR